MERLAKFDLPQYVKEDLIDLLEEHPNLFDMEEEELKKLAADKYLTAQSYIDRANRLESDASAIEKYCEARRNQKETSKTEENENEFMD